MNLIVSRVLKEMRDGGYLPPMLGNGEGVDLFKLYLCVRQKGGYESVSRNEGWDSVAKELGCDSSASTILKMVYVKYLELLNERISKNHEDRASGTRAPTFNDLLVDVMKDLKESADVKDVQSCVGSVGGVKQSEGSVVIESENQSSRKRKRERYLPLLDWVKRVAKDPCDPAIGSLPERSKWKFYGGDDVWKQVLSAREAVLSKRNEDSKSKSIWQKNLRMHPVMYDDPTDRSTSRCSQRLVVARQAPPVLPSRKSQPQDCSETSSTGSPSDRDDETSFWGYNFRRKRTPLGPHFQAKVPDSTQPTYESDTKWLGTPVWPLANTETRSSLIERERIGKGRQDACGCHFPGSPECIRFHVSEKRTRLRLELGSAFTKWKFDDMGEVIALGWTRLDEKKFEDIIKWTPSSTGRSFWDELTSHFKSKTRLDLVSYYFNVYLVRRRAHQNRSDPSNIDSDDDELEKVGTEASNNANGSILCSPKKVHLNANAR